MIDAAELVLASYEAAVDSDATDANEYVIAFEFSGDTYVMSAVDANGATDIAVDDIICLQGLTGVTDVATTAAANTILIA